MGSGPVVDAAVARLTKADATLAEARLDAPCDVLFVAGKAGVVDHARRGRAGPHRGAADPRPSHGPGAGGAGARRAAGHPRLPGDGRSAARRASTPTAATRCSGCTRPSPTWPSTAPACGWPPPSEPRRTWPRGRPRSPSGDRSPDAVPRTGRWPHVPPATAQHAGCGPVAVSGRPAGPRSSFGPLTAQVPVYGGDVVTDTTTPGAPSRLVSDRPRLILLSFLMLFVELAVIRWAGANVVYLAYFSNLVLLGSFLGIGLGFLWAGRGGRPCSPSRPSCWRCSWRSSGWRRSTSTCPARSSSSSTSPRSRPAARGGAPGHLRHGRRAADVRRRRRGPDVQGVRAARGLQARPHRQRGRHRGRVGPVVPGHAAGGGAWWRGPCCWWCRCPRSRS